MNNRQLKMYLLYYCGSIEEGKKKLISHYEIVKTWQRFIEHELAYLGDNFR